MSVADQLATGHDDSLEGVQGQHTALLLSAWWEAFIVALPSALASSEGALGAADIADAAVVQFRRVIIKETKEQTKR